jgi:hypothetical protein
MKASFVPIRVALLAGISSEFTTLGAMKYSGTAARQTVPLALFDDGIDI